MLNKLTLASFFVLMYVAALVTVGVIAYFF